ncbi:MAG: DUF177 domain-containing protein [Desulfobulbaceae bacterium]|nr:DUF177 domain-containing protein [Desulfobulbaceae bacterium]
MSGAYQNDDAKPYAHVELVKKSHTEIELRGKLDVTARLVCDRCLEDYLIPIHSEMTFILQYPSQDHLRALNVDGGFGEVEILSLETPQVDIEDILRQQFLLALPVKNLCSKKCKGLCSQCGVNLNKSRCPCLAEKEKSPFAVLAKFK